MNFYRFFIGILLAKYPIPIPSNANAKAIGTRIHACSLAKINTKSTIGMNMPASAGAIPIISFFSAILRIYFSCLYPTLSGEKRI